MSDQKVKFIKELSEDEQDEIIDYVLNRFNLKECSESKELYNTLIEYIKTVRRSIETFKKNIDEIIDLFFKCGYDNKQIISILTKEPSLLHSDKDDIFWRILLMGKVIDRKTNICVRDGYLVHNPRILRTSQDVIYARIKYLESDQAEAFLRNNQVLTPRQITKVTHSEFEQSYKIDKDTLLQKYPFDKKAQLEVISWDVNKTLLNDIFQNSNLEFSQNNNNLIEYLESKNFEPSEIRELQMFLYNNDKFDDAIKKFDNVYKVFSYAKLTQNEINILILKKKSLLFYNTHELINVAYVWKETGLLNHEDLLNRHQMKFFNYIKVFLRNLYLTKFNNSRVGISYHMLTLSEEKFINKYSIVLNGKSFIPHYEELVNIFGKGNTIEEKEKFVKKEVSLHALSWYLDCLKKDKEKNKKGVKE